MDTVSELLWDLSASDREKVVALVSAMRSSNPDVSADHYVAELYRGYETAVLDMGMSIPSRGIISRTNEYKKFRSTEGERVGRWVESAFKSKDGPTLRLACLEAARCLCAWLDSFDAPLSATTLLRNTHNIPTAVDFCYPGYVAHGILHNTIRLKGSTRLK